MSLWWSRQTRPDAARRSGTATIEQINSLFARGRYAHVSLASAEASLQSVAVGAAVDLIASLGSELPVHVYTRSEDRRERRPMPSWMADPAGDGQGLQDWCYQALTSWLLRGNVFGEVLDAGRGGVLTQVQLFHPDRVSPRLGEDGAVQWFISGREIPAERMLHRRVNPMPGLVLGLSPIALKAAQIGLTLTSTQFGLQWFEDGAHPGGLLINKERDLSPTQATTAKERFLAAVRGSREPAVLDRGWEYQQIQIAPEESQFLETQQFTEAQCARIFGPGIAETLGYSQAGSSLTYTNRVDRSADLLTFALNKWLRRLERLLGLMLPRPHYVRIDRAALLEMTTLDRYRAHEIGLRNKFLVINEVRADEELQPVPWGAEPQPAAGQTAPPNATEDGTS